VSGLSRKRASEAETAATLWSIVQLARQAGPIAKTAGAAARGGAKNAATRAVPYVTQARTRTAPHIERARIWTAPHIERSGLAIRDTVAPKIYETLVATARRVDVTPPTPPRRRRWPKLVAGTAIAAAAASAAAAVALRRRAKDGNPESPGEVAGATDGSPEAQPAADGSPEAQQPLAEADGSRAGPEAASPSPG
jgi:hypothetical protein